jgi:hypothetical protein
VIAGADVAAGQNRRCIERGTKIVDDGCLHVLRSFGMRGRTSRASFSVVVLRESGGPSIPETSVIEPRSLGVLGRPVKPGDDRWCV